MTFKDFKTELFVKRGAMKGVDSELHYIHSEGAEKLISYMLNNKKLGVRNMADMVQNYSHEQQDEIVDWLESHKTAKKKDIEAYLLSL